MTSITLSLEPLDGLFFRDGRPFSASDQRESRLPLPQTLAGALRTHLLLSLDCDFVRLAEALKQEATLEQALGAQSAELAAVAGLTLSGPWLALDDKEGVPMPLVPMPRVLLVEDGRLTGRLAPSRAEALPGWETAQDVPALPLLPPARWNGKAEAKGGWLRVSALAAFLAGGLPDSAAALDETTLLDRDHRVGIAIGPNGAAEDQMIYAAAFLALKPGVRFMAQLDGVSAGLSPLLDRKEGFILPWGGEQRRVVARRVGAIPWPKAPASTPAQGGRCLLLTTPAPMAGGWRGVTWEPVAAAIDHAVPVSGWDLAQGRPKPTRFAAPAGSVLFFRDQVPQSIVSDEDRRLGFGHVLEGVWTHE